MTGRPTMNMIILGTSSGLMTISTISGFISYGKLGSDPKLSGTKKILLVASLLSLFSAIMLGVGLFLVHRHSVKMERAFRGFFSFTLLVLAGLFMLISGIMYAVAAAKLNGTDASGQKYKDIYGTSYNTAVLSAVLTLGGLGLISVPLVSALLALRKQPTVRVGPSIVTTPKLVPSYQQQEGAEQQLRQLQTGERVLKPSVPPQAVGTA